MADDVVQDGAVGVPEAVRIVGLSRGELYKLMDSGRLAYMKYGRKRLLSRQVLRDFLASLKVEAGTLAPTAGRSGPR